MPHPLSWRAAPAVALVVSLAASPAAAATYEVGPGRTYSAIGEVPWESLGPGDEVLIHWRATPYREKWVIGTSGSSAQPLVVRGVPGPSGELPVITGEDATTRTALDFWNEDRGLLKIGGSSIPASSVPEYIVIDGLELRSARPAYSFTDDGGNAGNAYSSNAAALFVEVAAHLEIRNCVLRDSGNGLFIGVNGGQTQDVLVTHNWIYDNGIDGSIYQHNSYTAAIGITFEANQYGPLRAGCDGNNLKDRSAGLVVRYNWIESGNRQLDLVDGEDSAAVPGSSLYGETFVYGNVLIEPDGAGNRQIVHYGGDSVNTTIYRKGTLYFFNNTVVSTRSDRTTLFRLSTNEESADVRNNVFYVSAGGDTLSLLDADGVVDLSHNWMKAGWVSTFGTLTGTIHDDGTAIETAVPGFSNEGAQDFHLAEGSDCEDAGTALNGAVLPDHALLYQLEKARVLEARPDDGQLDVGAFEVCTAGGCASPSDGGGPSDGGPPLSDGGASGDATVPGDGAGSTHGDGVAPTGGSATPVLSGGCACRGGESLSWTLLVPPMALLRRHRRRR